MTRKKTAETPATQNSNTATPVGPPHTFPSHSHTGEAGTAHPVSAAIGANPRGAVKTVSLALRHALAPYRRQRWVTACSGGADSLAMTLLAADLAARWNTKLEAVIINHQMRPESTAEANTALEILLRWQIDAHIKTVTVPRSGGPESAARNARQAALLQTAGANGVILLGHTMDDQAETVLMGLGRGAGSRSLRGMEPVTVRAVSYNRDQKTPTPPPHTPPASSPQVTWLRPLLGVRRAQTRMACAQLGVDPVEDPTNAPDGPWRQPNGAPLPRVAIRHQVIPALSRALGRDVVPALAATATHLSEDADAINYLTDLAKHTARLEVENKLENDGETTGDKYHGYKVQSRFQVAPLRDLPAAAVKRLLIDAAQNAGAPALNRAQMGAAYALVNHYHGQGEVTLGGGVRLIRRRHRHGSVIEVLTRA